MTDFARFFDSSFDMNSRLGTRDRSDQPPSASATLSKRSPFDGDGAVVEIRPLFERARKLGQA